MTSVKRLLLNAPLVVLFLIAILVSGSRAGLVGFAVVVVLSLALNPRVRSVALSLDLRVVGAYFAGLAVVVLLAFVVPVQQVLVPGIPADEQRQLGGGSAAGFDRIDPGAVGSRESDSIRRQYIDNSIEFIRDRPAVGYGFQWIETSHNIYLQLLISGGVLALIGFLLVIFGYLREAWRIRSTVSGPWLDLLTACVVSVLAYLVMGLVSPDIVDRYVYVSAALILAMAVLTRSGIALPGSDGQPESAAGPASAASPEPSSGSGTAVAR
jgi:O-antigen ligase